MTDEIIREIRRVRHDISRRCDHDPRKVVAYYREFQEAMKRSGEYRFRGEAVETDDAEHAQANADTSTGTQSSRIGHGILPFLVCGARETARLLNPVVTVWTLRDSRSIPMPMKKWRKQWQSMMQHAEQGGTF